MLGRLATFMKRAELASELTVLEQAPNSRRAAEIRDKHKKAKRREKDSKFVYPILSWGLQHRLIEFQSFQRSFTEGNPSGLSEDTIDKVLKIKKISGILWNGGPHLTHRIRSIPHEVFLLPKLKKFTLSGVYMDPKPALYDSFPNTVEQSKNLKELSLTGCRLRTVPPGVFNPKIKRLFLNSNSLTHLPNSIGRAASLENLQLYGNKLETLPEEIGDLQNLKFLVIRGNHNLELPKSITKLKNLSLMCDANPRNLTDEQASWVREAQDR